MDARALADAMCRALRDDGPAARLAELVVDDLFDQAVGELIDAEELTRVAFAAIDGPAVERLIERHLAPAVALERGRVEESGEALGDALPEAVVAALEDRLRRPTGLPQALFDEVIDDDAARELVSGALADTVDEMLSGSSERGAGVRSALGWSARRLRSAGTGLLGSIGGGLQDGLRRQLREMASQSAARFRRRLAERAKTPEGAAALERLVSHAAHRILAITQAEIHAAADDPGVDALGGWLHETIAHNAARAEIRAALEAQLAAVLEREAERSLGALLKDLGLADRVRSLALGQGCVTVQRLAATAAYSDWLAELIEAAEKQR